MQQMQIKGEKWMLANKDPASPPIIRGLLGGYSWPVRMQITLFSGWSLAIEAQRLWLCDLSRHGQVGGHRRVIAQKSIVGRLCTRCQDLRTPRAQIPSTRELVDSQSNILNGYRKTSAEVLLLFRSRHLS